MLSPENNIRMPFRYFAYALGTVGATAIYLGSPWGLGLSPDSIHYVQATRAITEQSDFSTLPSHWPPGYPLLLSLWSILFGDVSTGARLLNAFLYFINLLLVSRLLQQTLSNPWIMGIFLVAFALQPAVVEAHLFYWTEASFISLTLLDLLLLQQLIINPHNRRIFLGLATVAGLAMIMRYAGLFLIAVNTLSLLLFRLDDKGLHKILLPISLAFASLIPMTLWILFNIHRGAGSTNRSLQLHLPGAAAIEQFFNTLAGWFSAPHELGVLCGIAILLLCLYHLRTPFRKSGLMQAALLALFVLGYIAFLGVSISLFDAHTPLDRRILLPAFPIFLVLIVYSTRRLHESKPAVILTASVLLGLILNIQSGVQLWIESRAHGLGLANRELTETPIMGILRQLPHHWRLATNGPEFFTLYLPQESTMFPRMWDPVTRQENPKLEQQLATTTSDYEALCYFTLFSYRSYLPDPEQLDHLTGFTLFYAAPDGLVWLQQTLDFGTHSITDFDDQHL